MLGRASKDGDDERDRFFRSSFEERTQEEAGRGTRFLGSRTCRGRGAFRIVWKDPSVLDVGLVLGLVADASFFFFLAQVKVFLEVLKECRREWNGERDSEEASNARKALHALADLAKSGASS